MANWRRTFSGHMLNLDLARSILLQPSLKMEDRFNLIVAFEDNDEYMLERDLERDSADKLMDIITRKNAKPS